MTVIDRIMPHAVVLGLSPTGLYAVRELGRAGIPVLGVSRYPQCGNVSRYLASSIVCPDENAMRTALLARFPNAGKKPVLMPTSDQDVDFLIKNAGSLAGHFNAQSSYLDGIASKIMTKASFYALCGEHGAAMPQWFEVERDQLQTLRSHISFPCLVKPSRIHEIKHTMKGNKLWVARDADEFTTLSASMPAGDYILIVQEIVPGPESNITLYCAYFDRAGEPRQAFTCRKLRQYPPGFGSASLVVSADLRETQEISEQLLRSIGYRGIAAAEFKRDPRDGRLKIIEINPRPSLWFSASTAAGKHLALAAYHDLAETGVVLPDTPQRMGVGWRYGAKDLYASLFYRLTGDFILPAPDVSAMKSATNIVDAVNLADDRAPAWAERRNFARKFAGRIVTRFMR
jgi:D-aspartate ligase